MFYSSSSLIVDKYRMGATRTLVITNLKQNTTVDGLKTTFETFGEIIVIIFLNIFILEIKLNLHF